jgi:mRNA interferase MazF
VVAPALGEVWYSSLGPVLGHEQDGDRPALVLSATAINQALTGMAVIVPITSRFKDRDTAVLVMPPEGGLRVPSYILCDQIRAVSLKRLDRRLGAIERPTLDQVHLVIHALFALRCPPPENALDTRWIRSPRIRPRPPGARR